MAREPVRDEVLGRYAEFLGRPAEAWSYDDMPGAGPRRIEVLAFAPSEPGDVWRYVTLGMSSLPMPGLAETTHRVELMLYAYEQHEQLPDVLAGLASYPFVTGAHLDAGHTIAGTPGEGVVPGSPLTEFLFTPLYFEDDRLRQFPLSDGTHVTLLWATPIYLTERRYALEHGWTRLVEGPFTEQEVEPGDLWRAAAV